jgi:hypothetical protein
MWRDELHAGFAWELRVMIFTADVGIRETFRMPHGSAEEGGCFERSDSVASACKLRENNSTLVTIQVKHNGARL